MKITQSQLPIVDMPFYHSTEKWYGVIYRCRRQHNKLIGFIWVRDVSVKLEITDCVWDVDNKQWVL